MTPTRAWFLALLAVELLLVAVAFSRRAPLARVSRLAIFAVPLSVAIALRAYQAFATPGVLDWDETYYLSLAVTAANGDGLYPYIFGFGPMRVMGGIGYAGYGYAAAVVAAGPTIFAPRAVSLAGSCVGLACLSLLLRGWYGSGTAWIGAALYSALHLFVISNTARMDSLAFAYAAAGLLVVAHAIDRGSPRWDLLAGLFLGLGLQVHIDTSVTAAACGLLYLIEGRSRVLWYAAGLAAGLALFVVCNILPDPDAFYRTTALTRVDATTWYSGGTSSLFASFFDPRILLAKEGARYGTLFHVLPRLEIALTAAAFAAALIRRHAPDRRALTLAAGVVLGAAVVLNTASPLYFIHVMPALLIPLAPLFTHGAGRFGQVSLAEVRLLPALACAVVIAALVANNSVRAARAARHHPDPDAATVEFVERVRAVVNPRCKVVGDGGLYVRHFADYPYFISTRPTEVRYAMLFHGAGTEAEYWSIKQPDVVLARTRLAGGLAAYVLGNGLSEVREGVWMKVAGCRGGP